MRPHPPSHLLLRLDADPWFAPRPVMHTLGLPGAIALRRDLLRPAKAYNKTLRQFFQRSVPGVVGRQKLPAQVIPIRSPHIGFVAEIATCSLHYYGKCSRDAFPSSSQWSRADPSAWPGLMFCAGRRTESYFLFFRFPFCKLAPDSRRDPGPVHALFSLFRSSISNSTAADCHSPPDRPDHRHPS